MARSAKADETTYQHASPSGDNEVHLKKVMGIGSSVGMLTGIMIGSGIFVSPNEVVHYTGSVGMAMIVWAVSGLMSAVGALCFLELGTMIPKNGSSYTYLYEAFGEIPAFLSLWIMTFLIGPASNAINALIFSRYLLQPFFGDCPLMPDNAVKMLAAGILALLGYVNSIGVKIGSKTQATLSAIKVTSLLVIIGSGAYSVAMGNIRHFQDPMTGTVWDSSSIATAFYSTWFAYSGWDGLNFIAEEVKNPNRNMPIAVGLSLLAVTIIYLFTNAAYFAVLTPAEVLSSNAVAVTFANQIFGVGSWVMGIFVAVSACGALNGNLVIGSRQMFAAGRERHLPHFLSFININNSTPVPAVVFTTIPSLLTLLAGDVGTLLAYSAFSANLITVATTCALFWLRYKQPERPRPFKVWLILPFVFLLVSLFISFFPVVQKPVEIAFAMAVVAVGLAAYFIFIRIHEKPKIVTRFMERLSYLIQFLLKCVPESDGTGVKIPKEL